MKQISIKTLGRTIVTGLLALAGILPVAQTASGSSCVTPPSSLAAWWQAEGNTSCGVNGFAPTPVGNLTYSNGEVGLAFSFDGSTSYIPYPALPAFNIGAQGSITIEGWVNPNYSETAAMPIIEWDSTNSDGMQLWLEHDHTLFANIKDTSGNNHGIISSNDAISTNIWQHVALTYDEASGIAVLYVNGSIAASNTLGSFIPQTTYPVNLGRRTVLETGYNDTFNGLMDELAIYSRALSQTEIQSIYNAGSAGKCPIVNTPSLVPVITMASPLLGTNGMAVTLSGTNFSPVAGSNIVYFGAVQATVTAASSNQLTAIVPPGATFAPITVTVGGLTAFSPKAFLPTFAGSTNLITSTNFGPVLTLSTGNGPFLAVLADLDGDGKPDLITILNSASTLVVYRNIGTNGTNAFAAPVTFALPATSPTGLAVADVDGDGKLDVVVTEYDGNQLSIFRNLSSPGSFTTNSLAAPVNLPTGAGPQGVVVVDLDGDGKPDLAVANLSSSTVSIYRNLSTPGSLTTNSFTPHVDLTTATGCVNLAFGDLDGDGKPDLVTANFFGSHNTISILRNTTTAGAFSANSFAPHLDLLTPMYPRTVEIRDVDGDGKPDIIVADNASGEAISVFRNLATPGTITNSSFALRVDFAEGAWADGLDLGDLNGDGRPDVAVAGQSPNQWSVFANLSTPGSFTSSSFAPRADLTAGSNPNSVAIGDLDGDGRPDVVLCNQYGNTIYVYQNITPFSTTSITNPPPPPATAVPVITSFTPILGTNGTAVTLMGTNFSSIASSNVVYFGAVQAVVTTASSNELTVIVPSGAAFAPITATVGGLTAFSPKAFLPTFAGNGLPLSTTFGPVLNIPGGSGPVLTVIADLDGDGKPDLAFVNYYDATLYVCRNTGNDTNGAATFAPPVIFNLPAANPLGLAAADIDGDGKLDLVVTEYGGNEISIYRNAATPGSFTTNSLAIPVSFATGNGPQGGAVVDLDGDGKPDIAVANVGDGTISVLRNLSTPGVLTTGSFAPHVDFATAGGCVDVVAADIDGDGKPDLVTPDYFNNTEISILRNTITAPGPITTNSFAAHLDLTTLSYPREVAIRDVDGDGKPDLVVAEGNGGNSVSVFRNLATPGTITNSSFAARVDFAEGAWANDVALGDLNGDGRPDIAVVAQASSKWSIFANVSTPGSFTNSSLDPRMDFASGSNPNGVVIGDLNGDGRPDVVFCDDYSGYVSVYQNTTPFSTTTTTNPPPPVPSAVPVITAISPVSGTNGTAVTLTGTNFSSIISSNIVYFGSVEAVVTTASSNELNVIVPPGAIFAPVTVTVGGLTAASPEAFLPTFAGNSLPISSTNFGPALVIPTGNGPLLSVLADLDGDGRPDLVTINYYDSTLVVYRNTSNGTNSFAPPVTFPLPSTSPLGLAVVDVDGDGKLDVIVTEFDGSEVSIFRNLASPGSFATNSLAAPVSFAVDGGPQGVIVADLDGDGKPDIATANYGNGTVSLLRNLSTPGSITTNSFAPHVDLATAGGCVNLAVGDIDGDGKLDLVTANFFGSDDSISILRNTSTPGSLTASSFAPHIDLLTPAYPRTVELRDVDGDGKPDIIVADNANGQAISVFRNLATPGTITTNSFASRVDFAEGAWADGLDLGDLNGDGRPDIAVAGQSPNQWSVFANVSSPGSFTTSSLDPRVDLISGNNPNDVTIGDLNGDGRPDVILCNQYGSSLYIYQNITPFSNSTSNPPPPPAICTPPATGIAAWWKAEGNTADSISGLTTPAMGDLTYSNGEVGLCFVFDSSTSYIPFPASSNLDIGASGSGITIETWIKPNALDIANSAPVIEWDSPYVDGLQLWVGQTVDANIRDTSGGSHFVQNTLGILNTNTWQHLALTYDKASGAAILYLNGAVVATNNFGTITPQTSYGMNIGRRTGQPIGLNDTYGGLMDELSLYTRALSESEIQAIFNAGSAGKCYTNTAPIIVTEPLNQTNLAGTTATFSVSASGTPLLSYQWFSNSIPLQDGAHYSGSATASLSISDVTSADAGQYSVVVTNLYGAVTSSIASLAIITPTQPGNCTPPPANIAAWWKGEGNTADSINGLTASAVGDLTYTNGEVGLCFAFDGSTSYIPFPASSNLDIGANGSGITIEAWVKPSAFNIAPGNAGGPIAEWDSSSTDGLEFWTGPTLFGNVIDLSGNAHRIESATGILNTNSWQYIVLTYDKASGNAVIYLNGNVVATNNFGTITPQTTYGMNIGRRTGQIVGLNDTYGGLLDELGLYSRALSQSEIQAIYNAGSAGKCLNTTNPVSTLVPVITAVAPVSGTNGTTVTLTGTNFSSIASSNIVYFGAVEAVVTTASSNELNVIVPPGAIFAPITVTVGGLTAASPRAFLPTFAGNSLPITSTNFGPALVIPTGNDPFLAVLADLDGDSRPDLVTINYYDSTLVVYRNTSNGTNSFAPPVTFPLPSTSPLGLAVADVDGDGKLDVVVTESDGSQVSIFRNLASPGSFATNSLAAPVSFAVDSNPQGVIVADLDGDGKPDIATANYGNGTVSLLRNLSTPGSITTNSFAPHVDLPTAGGCVNLAVGDIDGDGKLDLVTANFFGNNNISILRNTSTPGSLTTNSFAAHIDLPTPSYPRTVELRDVDGDGKPDIIVADNADSQAISVFRNLATPGTITNSSFASRVDFAEGAWADGLDLGDLNGDGRPDIAVAGQLPDQWSVFANISTPGSFTTNSVDARVDLVSGENPNDVTIGDLNGDGRPDVILCNQYENTIYVYQNITPFAVLTNPPPSTCTPPPANIAAWWKGEGNTADSIKGLTASAVGDLTYTNGEVGLSFVFDGSSSYIPFPASTNLDIGANGSGITIEAWVNPNYITNSAMPIIEWDSSSTDGLQLWLSDNDTLYSNLKDINGADHQIISPNWTIAPNAWQHVALTYDGASGSACLYVNGNLVASNSLGSFVPQTTYDMNIGRRTGQPIGLNDTYAGLMDELSLYTRALSQPEIQAIYNAGSAGKCYTNAVPLIVTQPLSQTNFAGTTTLFKVETTGSQPMKYQWKCLGTNIYGATNSSLILPSVSSAQNGTYAVTVNNDSGVAASSNATLKVVAPQVLSAPITLPNHSVYFTAKNVEGDSLQPSDLTNYEAQASTDLVHWVTLPNALTITNGNLLLQDGGQSNYGTRFYRIYQH